MNCHDSLLEIGFSLNIYVSLLFCSASLVKSHFQLLIIYVSILSSISFSFTFMYILEHSDERERTIRVLSGKTKGWRRKRSNDTEGTTGKRKKVKCSC